MGTAGGGAVSGLLDVAAAVGNVPLTTGGSTVLVVTVVDPLRTTWLLRARFCAPMSRFSADKGEKQLLLKLL